MTGTTKRVLFGASGSLRMTLPVAWTRALGLQPGDRVNFVFGDQIAIIIVKNGPEAERALKALRVGR